MACVQQSDNRKTGAIGCCRHDRVVDRQGVVLGPNRPRETQGHTGNEHTRVHHFHRVSASACTVTKDPM